MDRPLYVQFACRPKLDWRTYSCLIEYVKLEFNSLRDYKHRLKTLLSVAISFWIYSNIESNFVQTTQIKIVNDQLESMEKEIIIFHYLNLWWWC